MFKKLFLLIFFGSLQLFAVQSDVIKSEPQKSWFNTILDYKFRYNLDNANSKKVDNAGNGDDSLYGVRNFRVVLHGVLYRGGANNSYNKKNKRDNQNPLQKEGLQNLCQQNFETAVYLYKTNFSSAPNQLTCNVGSNKNKITYKQVTAMDEKQQVDFLKLIHEHIVQQNPKPIYAHCWNGWHASGLVSALSLIQFCGINNEQALEYWLKNTDGNTKGYNKIKERIKLFKALPELKISTDIQQQICPTL